MDFFDFIRTIFALAAVIGMIGLAALAARRFGVRNGGFALARPRRLALVETLALDPRRRAAIIACDGREHLVILDASRVTLIERAIPARDIEISDPVAAVAAAAPTRKLQTPFAVGSFLRRAPRDRTGALRAAGII